jgi:hypothetical protein
MYICLTTQTIAFVGFRVNVAYVCTFMLSSLRAGKDNLQAQTNFGRPNNPGMTEKEQDFF